ncbi:hypothetical protein F5Y01DRAFT_320382 [Xylaria sp. FL0043]|nr:hypothetical protein F5Y01DRAFT_320382 [Xylaria sp. FL0043]
MGWPDIEAESSRDKQSRELLAALKQLYTNGEYSDLSIVCRKKQYRVHKAIVCPRSEVLGVQASSNSTLDLSHYDPQVIDAMVHYLYHLDYDSPSTYAVKDGDTIFPYEIVDTNGQDSASPLHLPDLILHAKVYITAEEFGISGLETLALDKFRSIVRNQFVLENFLEAVKLVYELVPDSAIDLRDRILETLQYHRNSRRLKAHKSTKQLFKELPCLAFDLLMYSIDEWGLEAGSVTD